MELVQERTMSSSNTMSNSVWQKGGTGPKPEMTKFKSNTGQTFTLEIRYSKQEKKKGHDHIIKHCLLTGTHKKVKPK